jgi:hypothetical protein
MADQIFDAHHSTDEQRKRIIAATAIGLNALKPALHFQISMLRLWIDRVQTFASNYEKGVERFSTELERQWQQQRAA